MVTSPLIATPVAGPPDAAQVPPRRLAVIARKRLQDIGIQAFIVGDVVRGRMCIEPTRFHPWPGTEIDASQEFVVQGHDRLWLMKPSVLRFIGAVPFWDMTSNMQLRSALERKWADLRKQSTDFLEHARRYFPSIDLDTETWTLETALTDQFGVVQFRLRPYQGRVWVEAIAVDGHPIPSHVKRERLVMALPDDPAMFDAHTLQPVVNIVRSGATPTAAEHEPMVLELDIDNTNNLPVSTTEDLSLDLDLESLLTGDVSPPELDGNFLEVVEHSDPEPLEVRAPRLKTRAIEVVISTTTNTECGIVRDVNHGGVFVSLPEPERYPLDSVVIISGCGPFAARARVCHSRTADEGALLGTGAGIGIELIDAAVPRLHGVSAPVVVLTDTDTDRERRSRFAAIVAGATCTPLLADDLPQALLAARTLPVRAVVLDQSFADYGWREIYQSLRLDKAGVDLVVVTREAPEKFPKGVYAVAAQGLSRFLMIGS